MGIQTFGLASFANHQMALWQTLASTCFRVVAILLRGTRPHPFSLVEVTRSHGLIMRKVRMGGGSVNRGTSTMYCMSSRRATVEPF